MKKIEMKIQCPACKGTGVYVGMAERDGAAVVCHKCKGTGEYNYIYEYEGFTGKKVKEGVKRVYKSGYGFVIAPTPLNFKGIGLVDMSSEGVDYQEFVKGLLPEHTKKLACPMLANQGACHNISGFVDDCERLHGGLIIGMSLSKCNNQKNKLECWQRFNNARINFGENNEQQSSQTQGRI